ncbi:MAG: 5'-methylthioadenosine/adenosylhomocysteine nucleosidase [Cyanobacteria bacterium RUI128]|nr:5'-methylthioadenosine/adenosylhomocysteine nucleosidase [Cyanobacteria bacterium RUI128]
MKKRLTILIVLLIIVCSIIALVKQKETIAIIGAMDIETEAVSARLSHAKQIKTSADFQITTGNIGKYKIILTKSGVGKVNAAITTQYIIDKYKPKYIINTGLAGSLTKNLTTGDIIIAEKTIQHDFDLTAFGNHKGYMGNGTNADKPTEYFSDKNLISKFKNINSDITIGTIATGDVFVTDVQTKENIRKLFNADAADMESAAIAQTANRNNVPVIVIRTISDGKNESTKDYNKNKHNTAEKSALALISILEADK